MPHLCDKMRRLTSKDISKRKNVEEEPAPDFYSMSRRNPLPENASTNSTAPPQAPTTVLLAQGPGSFAEVELALLERRRADILERMNSLASKNSLGSSHMSSGLPSSLLAKNPFANPCLKNNGSNPLVHRQMFSGLAAAANTMDISKLLGLQNEMASAPSSFMGTSTGALNPFQF